MVYHQKILSISYYLSHGKNLCGVMAVKRQSGKNWHVGAQTGVSQFIPTAASGQPPHIQPRVDLFLSNSADITVATVSGPGVIGTTAGVLGSANFVLFSVPDCSLIVTASCFDITKATKGNYTFTITDASGTYTYMQALTAAPPLNPTAAMLPTINWITPAPTNFPLECLAQ
jgi:hypothetical protein